MLHEAAQEAAPAAAGLIAQAKPTHLSLTPGSEFVLAQPVNLMPAVDPADPAAAMAKVIRLPVGTKVQVLAIATKNSRPWYRVSAGGKEGWINSVALIGQID
jgi:hypothetical protein